MSQHMHVSVGLDGFLMLSSHASTKSTTQEPMVVIQPLCYLCSLLAQADFSYGEISACQMSRHGHVGTPTWKQLGLVELAVI